MGMIPLYSKGSSLGHFARAESDFNDKFAKSRGIVWRECPSCDASHKNIYIRVQDPTSWNAYSRLLVTWQDDGFRSHTGFDLYSTLEDALLQRNAWQYCNGGDTGIGFPRDCGPRERTVDGQWNLLTRGGQPSVRFSVYTTTKQNIWIPLYSKGSLGHIMKPESDFNQIFAWSSGIVLRECQSCSLHKNIFIRVQDPPSWNAYSRLLVTWQDDGFRSNRFRSVQHVGRCFVAAKCMA